MTGINILVGKYNSLNRIHTLYVYAGWKLPDYGSHGQLCVHKLGTGVYFQSVELW